jgi:glycerophosphoryl diester phosphodiesterase
MRKIWRRGLRWFFIIILGVVLYYALYFIFRRPPATQPHLIAHRGDSQHAPENTLAAFRSAIAAGADWLEFDVQMTKDGALVVIHDETVDRTTNGSGPVRELTLAEIRALDAGNGQQVPTFAEAIALAKQAGVKILPEAKSPHLYPGLEAAMLQILAEVDYLDKTAIQSFNPQTLETLKTLNPNLIVCPLYGPGQFKWAGPQPGQATIVCPMAEMVILFPWKLNQARAEGKEVFVWFGLIEHPLTMRLLLAMGADGLMVDDPVALAEILSGQ